MELHHSKHHQTYVNGLNTALKSYATATSSNDIANQISLQQAIKFHGGGHINHSLFWENLSPSNSSDAKPDSAPSLVSEIQKTWGSLDDFKAAFNKALLGIQGSGWGWLVKDTHGLRIVTTKDQDPIVGGEVPIFGVDMWEHAYYLQVSHRFVCIDTMATSFLTTLSISMAKRLMWRTSGMLSTGRRLRSDTKAGPRMPSKYSRRQFNRATHSAFCKSKLISPEGRLAHRMLLWV